MNIRTGNAAPRERERRVGGGRVVSDEKASNDLRGVVDLKEVFNNTKKRRRGYYTLASFNGPA